MVTAGATANTTVKNSRASRESGLLCSHSHGESIGTHLEKRSCCSGPRNVWEALILKKGQPRLSSCRATSNRIPFSGLPKILDSNSLPREKKLLCGPTERVGSPNTISINNYRVNPEPNFNKDKYWY